MRFRVLVAFLFPILAGCATDSNLTNTYNVGNLPESELSSVTCEETTWLDGRIRPAIVNVYSENGEEVIGTSFWGPSEYDEVTLQPGTYLFVANCSNGLVGAYPRAISEIEPSKKYIVSCNATTKKGFLGISMWDKVRLEIREIGAK